MKLPPTLLSQLYTFGSLTSGEGTFQFALENRLGAATLTRVVRLGIDGVDVPLDQIEIELGEAAPLPALTVAPERPAPLPLRQTARVRARGHGLAGGRHRLDITVETEPFGLLELEVADEIGSPDGRVPSRASVPYDKDRGRDYLPERVSQRQRFVEAATGVALHHLAHYSFEAPAARGNIESFTGVAQVPIGFAGPLRVNGEYAQGDFLIPLATTEGTLVASYNRGMKVLSLAGGVTCTVSADAMQRAPAFVFDSAREARAFRDWTAAHLAEIRSVAEATSHVAKLLAVETYLASKLAFLRFDFSTGDAAGQNMVGRATHAACAWILANNETIRAYFLESNLATDKKPSHINTLHSRGKHVTAEVVLPRELLRAHLRITPEELLYHGAVSTIAGLLAGVANNGLHAPNAITALFIATGQDVANVTEASTAVLYAEPTQAGDLYFSLTIPSLIVATHGGGTGLPTQRECLRVLGCDGPGTARKLAEIIAGVALAGELSLAAAIGANEWVSAHERLGRHR
jgi:hydroxymethylglutaryl-CoA reductase (NADPH)